MTVSLEVISDVPLDQVPDTVTLRGDVLVLTGNHLPVKLIDNTSPHYDSAVDQRAKTVISWLSKNYSAVVWILGFKDYASCDYVHAERVLMNKTLNYPNVHILETEEVELFGYVFFGMTLWGNFRGLPSHIQDSDILNGLDDVHAYMHPIDRRNLEERHYESLYRLDLQRRLHKGKRFVVISHASPLRHAVANEPQAHYFSSDLTEFISVRPQLELWITHAPMLEPDVFIKDVRIASTFPNDSYRARLLRLL